jgi:DNA repair photolyase
VKVSDLPEAPLDTWLDGKDPRALGEGLEGCSVSRTDATSALTPSGLEGFDWALNPYMGCAHRCAYCYAPSVLDADRETWGRHIRARLNMPTILSRELRRKARGVVGISTVTDPYQPAERTFKLTRYCLERLRRHDWPVCVLTKSDLVVRDLDLLGSFSEREVGFTVTTMDEHQRRLMEPGAPPVARRLAAMRLLSEAGVPTYAFVGPIYPTATVNELRTLVRQVHEAGARYVLVDRLNLKRGVWLSVSRALGGDQDLMAVARRRMFPPDGAGEGLFYGKAFGVVEDEARALGLRTSRA